MANKAFSVSSVLTVGVFRYVRFPETIRKLEQFGSLTYLVHFRYYVVAIWELSIKCQAEYFLESYSYL